MKFLQHKKIAMTLAVTIVFEGISSSINMNHLVSAEKESSNEIHIQPMHISNELYTGLKKAKASDKFSCIVIFNSHVDENGYAAFEEGSMVLDGKQEL